MNGRKIPTQKRTKTFKRLFFDISRWILDTYPGVQSSLQKGRLCLGTTDAYLLRALTSRKVEATSSGTADAEAQHLHATDVTHAAMTGLMNLETLNWDEKLCSFYGVPVSVLPKIRYNLYTIPLNLERQGAGEWRKVKKLHN